MTRGRGLHRRQRPELLSLRSAPVRGLPTYLGAVVWSKLWVSSLTLEAQFAQSITSRNGRRGECVATAPRPTLSRTWG
jgi:hypothetical protein